MGSGNSRRWTRIFRPDARSEINEELAFHIEQRERDYVARGLDPKAAHTAALQRLGDLEEVRDECTSLLRSERRARARRELVMFSALDFKLGLRMLARYPGLTVVGGLAMALAIAVAAGAFEVVRQVVNPTLPFHDGDRIVAVRNWDAAGSRVELRAAHDFVAWREQLRSIDRLGAYRDVRRNLITGETSEQLALAEISASAFAVTGAVPLLGRVLSETDEAPGAPAVIVIGYDVWQSRFGGDPNVVGRGVRLGSVPATVVGVMPEDFHFPFAHSAWSALRRDGLEHEPREGPAIRVFGRLARGVSLEEAQAELTALGQRAATDSPATHQHLRPFVMPFARAGFIDDFTGPIGLRGLLGPLFYSSNIFFIAFLALIAANIALLMFARAAARESEITVRSALGASRGRITMQLVAEALVLGAGAAMIGLAAAGLALRFLISRFGGAGGDFPFWFSATLSLPSVLYAVGLTLVGASIAGVLPALKVTRAIGAQLRQATAGSGGLQFGGVWTAVIVAQVAFTVLFVAITFYMTRLTARIDSFAMGFNAKEYASVTLQMDTAIAPATYTELKRRVATEPGVAAVTVLSEVPGNGHERLTADVEGVGDTLRLQTASVDLDFFDAMGATILAGRGFHSGDFRAESRVVVVNQAFAERILGKRNPIGRRVRFQVPNAPGKDPWGPWHDIVGVSRQIVMSTDPELNPAGIYLPLVPGGSRSASVVIRLNQDLSSFAPRLRRITTAIDPNLRLDRIRLIEDERVREVHFYRLWTRLLIGVSALVLALSLAGLYAIMAFTVSRRTREIGIRVALGADRRRLVTAVFKRPLAQIGLGVGSGIGILIIMLGGIPSFGAALTILAFAAVMTAVCMLAGIVPVRRALRIDPIEALKSAD